MSVEIKVRPTKVELSGVKHHTVQGTNILLKCTVSGARPAANVTWYNNTLPLDPAVDSAKRVITTRVELKNDGTFETTSKMEFTATRFENGISIRCEADNLVMWEDSDKPIHDTMMLEVMCKSQWFDMIMNIAFTYLLFGNCRSAGCIGEAR